MLPKKTEMEGGRGRREESGIQGRVMPEGADEVLKQTV